MARKFGLYHYNKKKGLIPLDKDNKPLFKFKKDYQEFINSKLLPELGLFNKKIKDWAEYKKPIYEEGAYGRIFHMGDKKAHRPFERNSGLQCWNMTHYIYLEVDETKISINTLLQDFKIKKNSKAFVINYIQFNKNIIDKETYKSKPTYYKVYAFPIVEGYNLMRFKNEVIPKYKGAVKFQHYLVNLFDTNVEIRTIPDNRLLQFHELLDYVKNRKEVNVYDCIKVNQSVFSRNYQPKNDWLEMPSKDGSIIVKYKQNWIMNEFISNKQVIDKSLKVFPCLINQFYDKMARPFGIEELDVRYRNHYKTYLMAFFTNKVCNFDKKYLTNEIEIALKRTFDYCFYNRKELCVNQKFISNQDLLDNKAKIFIKTFILPKVLEDNKDHYKREDCQKQFNFILEQFTLEVFGQMYYDELNNNKSFNSKLNQLELDENIKHTVISDKWFNLFIANLKDNYKWLTIKPNSNLKYKLLKSLGLDINNSFIKGLYCKSIITSVKNIFNFIKDKVKDLFNILSIRDNIIILYVKIALVKNELLKQIDEVLENYEQKLAPPLIKMDDTESFWSQFGVKFEHHKKDDVEDILDF